MIGEEARGLISQNDAVNGKDKYFQISVMKQYLVDAPRIELIMTPDEKQAPKLAKAGQKSANDSVKQFGTEALKKIGRENTDRVASLKTAKLKAT